MIAIEILQRPEDTGVLYFWGLLYSYLRVKGSTKTVSAYQWHHSRSLRIRTEM